MCNFNKSFAGLLIVLLFCGLCLFSCGGTPAASSTGSKPSAPSASSPSAPQPAWVTKPESAYPSAQYVVATGEGRSAEEAQYKARVGLLQIFGMKLADESVIQEMYQETSTQAGTNWANTVSVDRKITASAEGILSGCEIKEQWKNDKGNEFHALAVMEKAKTLNIYPDIIKRISQGMTEVLNIPNKNTFEGYARYRFAATLAKDIDSCINVLRFAGGSTSVPAGLKTENEYLAEANNIIRTIPVRVAVTTGRDLDQNGRIQAAFAKTIGNVGFRTGDNNSPYALEITLAVSPVELAGQTNKFARYEITANLVDTKTRQGVLPTYSINGREGHATQSEANNRAIAAAERKINEDYKGLLEENLSQIK